MAPRRGERVEVMLTCGHRQWVLIKSALEQGRGHCRSCNAMRSLERKLFLNCTECGQRLNRYNVGPRCGACEEKRRRG